MTAEGHEAAVKLAKQHGMLLYELTSRAVLAVAGMQPVDQRAFLGGDKPDTCLPAGERVIPLTKLCNMLQHDAVGLDSLIDDAMADGKLDDDEKAKVRQFLRGMLERLCQASAYVTPSAAGAAS